MATSNGTFETMRSPEFRSRWGWFVALGIVSLVAGIIALGSVVLATVVSVFMVGAMMIVSGVFEMIHGFQMKSWGRFFLWIVIGLIYVLAGLIAFSNPLLASAVLTLMLGIGLIAAGIVRIALATSMRTGTPWVWVVVSGIISLLLGAMIVFQWPMSSLYILGIFLGVDLVMSGIAWLSVGFALRRL
ncbi:HdeD family acid-resistance protein [Propylenella binzhouense]|uniref:HdeD family acid-resistance protein n=1 Tax=Propylenella binzhouense TaxID=2555902 RepID=A0A964T1V8_9HYPH|nr:HdeD family acid-resistance protein [Propylenella binzhouense]MYZ46735.1 HdeD family acid-resistance protein [Propylenella binzhouense]